MPRFKIIQEEFSQTEYIQDTIEQMNLFAICQGMMGVRSNTRQLAQEVCDWMNQNNKEMKP